MWMWATYFVGVELVLWLHGLGALFAAALGGGLFLALASQRRLRREIVPFLAVHALAALAWLPCLLVILEQRQAWTQGWLRFSWDLVIPGLENGLAAPEYAGWALGLLALIGVERLLRRREDRPILLVLLASALLPTVAAILISVLGEPVFLARTLVPSVLPVLLLAAAGAGRVPTLPGRALAFAAALGMLGWAAVEQVQRPHSEQWDRLAAWLERRVAPGEEVWLLPNELALPMRYAIGGAPAFPMRGIPAEFPAPNHAGPRYTGTIAVPGIDPASGRGLVEDARRRGVEGVWVVSRFPHWFDPHGHLRRALGRPIEATAAFAPILVERYRLNEPSIPPPG